MSKYLKHDDEVCFSEPVKHWRVISSFVRSTISGLSCASVKQVLWALRISQ